MFRQRVIKSMLVFHLQSFLFTESFDLLRFAFACFNVYEYEYASGTPIGSMSFVRGFICPRVNLSEGSPVRRFTCPKVLPSEGSSVRSLAFVK